MNLFWIALRTVSTCKDHTSILEQGYDYLLFEGNDLHRVVRHEEYLVDRVTGQCFSGARGIFEYPAWGTNFITEGVCFFVREGSLLLWSDGRGLLYESDLGITFVYPVILLADDGSFSPAFIDASTGVAFTHLMELENGDYKVSSMYVSKNELLRRLI